MPSEYENPLEKEHPLVYDKIYALADYTARFNSLFIAHLESNKANVEANQLHLRQIVNDILSYHAYLSRTGEESIPKFKALVRAYEALAKSAAQSNITPQQILELNTLIDEIHKVGIHFVNKRNTINIVTWTLLLIFVLMALVPFLIGAAAPVPVLIIALVGVSGVFGTIAALIEEMIKEGVDNFLFKSDAPVDAEKRRERYVVSFFSGASLVDNKTLQENDDYTANFKYQGSERYLSTF